MNPQTQDENHDQPVYPSNPATSVSSSSEADAVALQAIDDMEVEAENAAPMAVRPAPEPIEPIIAPASPTIESTPIAGPISAPADTPPTTVPVSGFQSPVEDFTQPATPAPVMPNTTPAEAPSTAPTPAPTPQASSPFVTNASSSKKAPLLIATVVASALIGIVVGYLIWQAL